MPLAGNTEGSEEDSGESNNDENSNDNDDDNGNSDDRKMAIVTVTEIISLEETHFLISRFSLTLSSNARDQLYCNSQELIVLFEF